MDAHLVAQFVSEKERLAFAALEHAGHAAATACFTMKEAVYKCYYALTGDFLDFHDVELAIDASAGTARATVTRRNTPFVQKQQTLDLSFGRVGDHQIALVALII